MLRTTAVLILAGLLAVQSMAAAGVCAQGLAHAAAVGDDSLASATHAASSYLAARPGHAADDSITARPARAVDHSIAAHPARGVTESLASMPAVDQGCAHHPASGHHSASHECGPCCYVGLLTDMNHRLTPHFTAGDIVLPDFWAAPRIRPDRLDRPPRLRLA